MPIKMKRIYDEPAASDGVRVLVDRLWPRGITKQAAAVDVWAKDIAPSNELRKAYHADREQWGAFKKAYKAELRANAPAVDAAVEAIKTALTPPPSGRGPGGGARTVTLLTSAKTVERSHVEVLGEVLGGRV
ncbi:MAG: DUF488 family protein [Phycisphaerales bacterium]|nr:DUF488 family protein [Phycisphaerales bacterium]